MSTHVEKFGTIVVVRLLSPSAAGVLNVFLTSPATPRYGYELIQATGIKSGSLYPVLGRFEKLGWISGSMEASVNGRPPRKVYEFNTDCIAEARAALDRFFEMKQIPASEQMNWGF